MIQYPLGPDNTCPKCSCMIMNGSQKEHNDNCTSTAVEDRAKAIKRRIDDMIMDRLMGEAKV